jgi:TolB-like protein/Tfp pilus assembly protein PilF
MASRVSADRLRFGNCVLDGGRSGVVAPDGSETILRPKTLELLRLLLARPGRTVSRDEIMEAVWPGVFVTDDTITQSVVEIRKAMGPAESRALRTLRGRGYILDTAPQAAPEPPREGGRGDGARVPMLAVLAFRLRPADPTLELFAEALHEGVVGSLTTLREPAVISTNSTRQLADAFEADIQSISRRLGADYVASGTLRRIGNGVRLGVEVSDGRLGTALWLRSFDVPDTALFQAPDEMAAAIANAIAPRVKESELRRLRSARNHDLGAYQLLLEARSIMFRLEPSSFNEAERLLRRAAAADPGFAAPWAALGDFYSLHIGQNWSDDPAADAQRLDEALHRALELDPEAARALALLGHTHTILHRRYDEAFDLLERATAIAPNDAETCMWSSLTYAYSGDTEEGIRLAERAIRLSPEDPLLFRYEHFLSNCHYMAGDYDRAASWGRRSLRRNPSYLSNLRATAAALVALGRLDEARDLGQRVMALLPGFRLRDYVARLPFHDPATREELGRRLQLAGLPP